MASCAHRSPPAADRVDRKARRVVVGADAHPSDIVGQVIDALGYGARELGVDKVVDVDLVRRALRSPLPAVIAIVPNEFFFLRVNRYDRFSGTPRPGC